MNGNGAREAVNSGVDELIARLRDEGVAAGREEAERIVREARAEARRIVDKASAEARDRRERARKEAESFRNAGEEALKTAVRDTVLTMKTSLLENFSADVERLVAHTMEDPELLKRMIIEVAGRVAREAGTDAEQEIEVVLPRAVIGLEELRRDPQELEQGRLTGFVFGLTGEMLREGVTFASSDEFSGGVMVRVHESGVTIDLTAGSVAGLLLQHLQPRFRAILEGVVR